MAPSSRKRQKQTRLAFTPLPSSSPASSSYNKQIRDRAAAVGYEGSPSPAKRRKVRDASGLASSLRVATEADGNKDTSMQPTPDATNRTPDVTETVNNGDDSDSVKLSQSQRMSSRKRMKQRKLDFDSSPPPSTSRKSVTVTSPLKPRTSRSSQPTPKAGFFGTQKTIPIDSSDDEDEHSLPERSSRSKRNEPSPQDEIFEYAKPVSDKDDREDEDEDEEEEEEEVVMPMTPAARRRHNVTKAGPDVEPARDSSPFPAEDDEDSDDVVVTGSRTRGKRKAVSRSSDEDSPVEAPRSRKRLRRALNPITEEEQQDLEDDLRDLASSGSETEIRPSQRKKKNPRQEALERLKRKRRGAPLEITDEENEESQQDEGIEEDEAGDNVVISDDEAEDTLLPPKAARRNMFSRDEDDEGFVIDDVDEGGGNGPLGVPENVPIAFTRYASMKAKDLFKFAIDWMVQKKINPAFQINDEIYDLAFKKLDDEVKGLAGSKFTSSAWTPEFTFSLEARPEIESGRIDRGSAEHFLRDKCDACNRSGHPATYEVRFQGTPYHPVTLEPIATVRDDSDSDSESSSESEENEGAQNRDSKGRPIASADKIFYLGKFCFANAQTAHSLSHWRFHLFEWVVDYLNQAGYNAPAKIVKRDSWSTRKRRKYANKIVDAMQTDGKIKALYHDFKNEIDSARNSKQGRFDSSP